MECFLGLEFNGDTAASEREEAAERMSVRSEEEIGILNWMPGAQACGSNRK